METRLKRLPPRETLGVHVLAQIKELLLSGRVMPGEQLPLRATAEALGVSVMPVREAVYQLVSDQALEVAPNRSVRVPVLTPEQFEEITRLRLHIEGYAAEQAAQRADAALIRHLTAVNEALTEAMSAAPEGSASVVELNKALHFAIYEAAGMPMLLKLIEILWLREGPVLNYDLRIGSERTRKKIAVAHHRRLIEALERHDGRAARDALADDIRSAYEAIRSRRRENQRAGSMTPEDSAAAR